MQLNLFLCCPFGNYELELVVESFSDEGSELEQRTSWEIENGPDEVFIQFSTFPCRKKWCYSCYTRHPFGEAILCVKCNDISIYMNPRHNEIF